MNMDEGVITKRSTRTPLTSFPVLLSSRYMIYYLFLNCHRMSKKLLANGTHSSRLWREFPFCFRHFSTCCFCSLIATVHRRRRHQIERTYNAIDKISGSISRRQIATRHGRGCHYLTEYTDSIGLVSRIALITIYGLSVSELPLYVEKVVSKRNTPITPLTWILVLLLSIFYLLFLFLNRHRTSKTTTTTSGSISRRQITTWIEEGVITKRSTRTPMASFLVLLSSRYMIYLFLNCQRMSKKLLANGTHPSRLWREFPFCSRHSSTCCFCSFIATVHRRRRHQIDRTHHYNFRFYL